MATSSRGDKGKAPIVEQKDIGTEEGELLDVRPPLPEPVGRSGGDKKRKKPAREEEGPLAVALLPPTAEEKRDENARKKAEKEEKYRQNSIFRHRWFVWFTQETNNQTPLEKRFFTPGSLRGIQNFRSHLMELAIVKFLEEKEKPDVRPWETSVSAMSQRLARFLEEVPKNWDKHFDVWLKSREFEIWTEDADWDETKSRADSGRDNENRPLSPLIKRSMVFVGIGDLGWAQTFEEVQKDFDPYPMSDPNPRRWIAPELHPRLAIDDEDGNKYMTKFSQESDIYAL
ncbi:hypothetical protein R1sor_024669 [Riccia sorocarpa]|uniref:Uncharacterized protein n=1 Tax=Riccia sorocarpa TaxID=122646 RepID=A0ABD3GRX4_9MARC